MFLEIWFVLIVYDICMHMYWQIDLNCCLLHFISIIVISNVYWAILVSYSTEQAHKWHPIQRKLSFHGYSRWGHLLSHLGSYPGLLASSCSNFTLIYIFPIPKLLIICIHLRYNYTSLSTMNTWILTTISGQIYWYFKSSSRKCIHVIKSLGIGTM